MKKVLRDNGLSIVLLALFAVTLAGQALAGHAHQNEDRAELRLPPQSLAEYLASGEFVESVFENWESEFLQMAMFLLLTAVLFQRGSAESHDPDEKPDPEKPRPDSPWPVKRGGLWLALYRRSLTLALFALFVLSFLLHAYGGAKEEHVGLFAYIGTSKFWFESFQNWQSEFLSVAAMVILSIWLRQAGSPESKPVEAPHSQTGN